jgi:hypothetical protein
VQKALLAVESGYISAENAAMFYGAGLEALEEALIASEKYSENLAGAALAVRDGMLSAAQAADIFGVSAEDLGDAIASARLDETIENITGRMDGLINSYDKAYNAAYSSIGRQIGLFNDMSTAVSEYAEKNAEALDPAKMIAALESQALYIEQHREMLAQAFDLGLDETIIAQLSNGSVESAATLAAIVNAGEEKIGELNAAFAKVEDGRDLFASTVAEMQTNFSDEMDALVSTLEEALGDMDLYAESKNNAVSTIQGYIDGVESMLPAVRNKMSELFDAINIAAPSSELLIGIPGFAGGTDNAPNMFVAGERGPELIVGAGGSTVYTADETSRILANPRGIDTDGAGVTGSADARAGYSSGGEKRITLDITGHGEIEITGGADAETVWEFVAPKLKDEFINILRDDVFEEGDLSYGF